MDGPTELAIARDAALRAIGRNVVNFQKVESCLRFLVAVSEIKTSKLASGPVRVEHALKKKRAPFGDLINMFHRSIYGAQPDHAEVHDDKAIVLTTSFRLESDPIDLKSQKRALSKLLAERNQLIHKNLATFDGNSLDSCRDLEKILDIQNNRILEQLARLSAVIASYKEFVAEMEELVNDGDLVIASSHANTDA